ncbi:site-specific DNA-methyltransferase [uncultured Corynebacterium sp.]|uniref:site-specific DNA-methyltransferase n=1 Tax=uncultured Corynebacterium sp. TaxID=159447 RepID=UPI00259B03B3|nr:site-specific DNA-methyltransferase [uncultured Corynebacterium sp.]
MLWQPLFYDNPPHGYELDDDQIAPWSPDFRTELAKQLAEIAPEAVADGKIDVETLKKLLEGDASDTSERFGLFWPGKKRAMRAAQTPTSATLVPDFENSKDWNTTRNVFIEGDNLEVLKILQKHYHGKIKMIYIDPPYNTGKDFVYPDNYREGLDNYLEWSKQVNEEGQKLSTNTDTGGRLHTNWLNMMYPRLKLARNLLTEDGVIFISIDDTESARLRNLCDEIFGEQNFIAQVVIDATPKNDPLLIATSHEYCLVYVRNLDAAKQLSWGKPHPLTTAILDLVAGLSPAEAEHRLVEFYRSNNLTKDNIYNYRYVDDVGVYRTGPLDDPQSKGPKDVRLNPLTGNPLKIPSRGWSCNRETWDKWVAEGLIHFPSSDSVLPAKKTYLTPDKLEVGRSVLKMQTRKSSATLASLLGGKGIFQNPKPLDLISYLTSLFTNSSFTILDFFAGSGTTAQAVMELNASDGGNRSFIQVQLPEPTPGKSAARKAGFSDIAQICRERIKRAGSMIEQEHMSKLSNRSSPLDTGFRAYKLSDTNFTKWHLTADAPANEVEQHILDIQESSKDSATQDALLTELLLKQGMSLTEQITQFEVAELTCHAVLNTDSEAETEDQYVLIAYVDEQTKPTLEQLRAIVKLQPARLVILEDAFQGDDQLKTNLKQMCVTNDIELKTA